jgi:hypothetical protein
LLTCTSYVCRVVWATSPASSTTIIPAPITRTSLTLNYFIANDPNSWSALVPSLRSPCVILVLTQLPASPLANSTDLLQGPPMQLVLQCPSQDPSFWPSFCFCLSKSRPLYRSSQLVRLLFVLNASASFSAQLTYPPSVPSRRCH